MSTALLDIPQALEARAIEVLTPLVGADAIAYPNVLFEPKGGTPWARVDHLPARTSPAGLGQDAQTRHPGVFQVSLFFPLGDGAGAANVAAQAVCDGFARGTTLQAGATLVRIQSASAGPALREEPWWMRPVTVFWLVHA
ncbi:phage tail terminator-like protein [Corallococcus sp. bb12-1]|uniref:phage tail terminator-like protein n=1 Tax=Corallococcus sp. bb12-1 TaxID=2996784 RepID=UPI00226EA414|nr:phage tail terminator-like protein [Corallococcus sp. bb12-1]MCY1042714.1 phage tail terminator-like protein [Corallococcus sp. bb12-1]